MQLDRNWFVSTSDDRLVSATTANARTHPCGLNAETITCSTRFADVTLPRLQGHSCAGEFDESGQLSVEDPEE